MRYSKILIVVMMFLLTLSSVFAIVPQSESLRLSVMNQDPDPAQPGDVITVRLRLENIGRTTAQNVQVIAYDTFPFSLKPGEDRLTSVGAMGAHQRDSAGVVIEYDLIVARDAPEGTQRIRIGFKSANSAEQIVEIPVRVRTRDTGLEITQVAAENLVQGKPETIGLTITNPSDSTLRSVTARLILDDVPFAPHDSATSRYVSNLGSQDSALFRFRLVALPNAVSGMYRVPIEIEYFDSLNEKVFRTEMITLSIGATPDVRMLAQALDFTADQNRGTIRVEFVNRGLTDVKFLDLELLETEDYEVLSRRQVYIGSVDSDDFDTAEFTIARKSEATEFDVHVAFSYMDSSNNPYQDTMQLPVRLHAAQSNGGFGIWIIVIVLIAGFIFWKRRAKKRD
ncbi:MAG: COG1361 S-layer family protein [Candidatus Woesearchaeota archaeon]